jgi:hypothetical protein
MLVAVAVVFVIPALLVLGAVAVAVLVRVG